MIEAHESEGIVDFSASARVTDLPFATGDRVRILVLRENSNSTPRHSMEEIERSKQMRRSLQGSFVRYDDPMEPVGVDDWEVLNDDPGAR